MQEKIYIIIYKRKVDEEQSREKIKEYKRQ
jgi:hypothetical protein